MLESVSLISIITCEFKLGTKKGIKSPRKHAKSSKVYKIRYFRNLITYSARRDQYICFQTMSLIKPQKQKLSDK